MKRVYYFAGAGGTGKTKVLERVLELCTAGFRVTTSKEEMVIHPVVKIFPSVVRGFYAQKGVANEQEMLNWPEERRFEFQQDLVYYYLDKTEAYLTEQPEMVDFALFDRSPLDHLAYLTYNSQTSLTLDDMSVYVKEAVELLETVPAVIFQYKYPQPWSPNAVDPDEFRAAHPGKNLIIAGLIRHYVEAAALASSPMTYSRDWRHWIVDDTVDARAHQVLDHMIQALVPDGLKWDTLWQ